MSTIGTGIAASVANTANQAKQVSDRGGRTDAQRSDSAKQTDKLTLTQLHDAGATRDTDQEMPDHQALGYQHLLHGEGEGESEEPGQDEAESEGALEQIHAADAPTRSPLTYGPDSEAPILRSLDLRG